MKSRSFHNLFGLICVSKVREVFENEIELEVEIEITLIQSTLAIVDKSRQVFGIIRNIEDININTSEETNIRFRKETGKKDNYE